MTVWDNGKGGPRVPKQAGEGRAIPLSYGSGPESMLSANSTVVPGIATWGGFTYQYAVSMDRAGLHIGVREVSADEDACVAEAQQELHSWIKWLVEQYGQYTVIDALDRFACQADSTHWEGDWDDRDCAYMLIQSIAK